MPFSIFMLCFNKKVYIKNSRKDKPSATSCAGRLVNSTERNRRVFYPPSICIQKSDMAVVAFGF